VLFHERPERRARLGSYLATLGLYELWWRRAHLIVTDRRLMAVRGVVSRDQRSIPLRRVERLTLRGGGRSSTVLVETMGGALGTQPFGPMSRRQARALSEAIERGRGGARAMAR
jgi:hypothetical protein